jgi:dihydropyrimidinase
VTDPILITGGTVVTDGTSARADVLLIDGRVSAVGALDRPADAAVVDAADCLVLPGAVDVHIHPFGNATADSTAALCGGTTSGVAFVDEREPETPAENVRRVIAEELPASRMDLALHAVVWHPGAHRPGDLAELVGLGVTSVKLWLAYEELGIMASDDQLYALMSEAAAAGILVLAHCENGPLIGALARRARDAGQVALSEHARLRPIGLEAEAVGRFLRIADLTGARAYVVHVSGRDSLSEVVRGRARGLSVAAESCIHHLIFDEGVYSGPDPLRYIVTPPLRTVCDSEALWRALADGTLDVFSSDHGHVTYAAKQRGGDDVTLAPAGLPGIQWRLAVGFTHGVGAGRLSAERLVELACAAPARILGLYPRKGTLMPGADADVVIWDPERDMVVGPETRRDGLDYSPYDGMRLAGPPRVVIAGGDIVARDGDYLGGDRSGRFLARAPLTAGNQTEAPHVVTAG